MYEYNELTKALLAEGYSTEDYPDYVEIDTSRLPGTDPLHIQAADLYIRGLISRRWFI